MLEGRQTERADAMLAHQKNYSLLYLHPNQYNKMILSFLKGHWPVFPVPPAFEYAMYQASTLDERAQVIVDILYTAIDPRLLKIRFCEKNWTEYKKAKRKKHQTRFRINEVNIPDLQQFTTKTIGKIIRSIGLAISMMKRSPEMSEEAAKRITYLKFYLAGKPNLIQQALSDDMGLTRSAWKDVLYKVSRYDGRFAINIHDAYTTTYTIDRRGVCSGFCGTVIHAAPEEDHTQDNIKKTLKSAAKHAVRLLLTLPANLAADKYDQRLKNMVPEIEKEMKIKTANKCPGVSLLVYRAIKRHGSLHLIGINIGNSILLQFDPTREKLHTVSEAREFRDTEILLGTNHSEKYDTKIINYEDCDMNSIFVALSSEGHKSFGAGDFTEERKGQRRYVRYSLPKMVMDNIQGELLTSGTPNAKQLYHIIDPKSDDRNANIVAMQMPTNHRFGRPRKHVLFLPMENRDLQKRKKHVSDYLCGQFQLQSLNHRLTLHANRIINAHFAFDNLYDFASYLEAERNALSMRELTFTDFNRILVDALVIFKTKFTVSDGTNRDIIPNWIQTDSRADEESGIVYYNPVYNREFASRLLSCAYSLSSKKTEKPFFSKTVMPKVNWGIAQIAIAGTLAKKIIRCRTIEDYVRWREEAFQKYQCLNKKSTLYKTLDRIIFHDLELVVSVDSFSEATQSESEDSALDSHDNPVVLDF